jgi:rubrerythrin
MPSLTSKLLAYVGTDERGVHRECRNCGTAVGDDIEQCPVCDSDEIARLELG